MRGRARSTRTAKTFRRTGSGRRAIAIQDARNATGDIEGVLIHPAHDEKVARTEHARHWKADRPPSCDAVPAAMIDGTPTTLRDDLVRILGDKQVSADRLTS
jgi:hypothetical protein